MYRAPVEEIAFTLKHVAGLKPALDAGAVRRSRRGPGRCDPRRSRPFRHRGGGAARQDRRPARRGARRMPRSPRRPAGRISTAAGSTAAGTRCPARRSSAARPCRPCSASPRSKCGTPARWPSRIGPTLTMGAVEALDKHASDALKATYLAKLVSGEWMGTMNLTEPQAGSDLAALRARAERGRRRHLPHLRPEDLHHLWRARSHRQHRPSGAGAAARCAGRHARHLAVPGAEIPGQRGRLARRAATTCSAPSLEHKLGIHGSPTCTMIYGDGFVQASAKGAVGWLIGEENKGLACMFTMMNNARLAVGMQGVGVAEAATQKALAYANERRQGKAAGYTGDGMAPIVHHPDVAAQAADHEGADADRPRHQLFLRPCDRHGACRDGDEAAPLAGARQSADADRQGLLHRCRRRGRLARRPGAWRHGLHRGDRRGSASIAMPASRRSTRAPTASRRSTW